MTVDGLVIRHAEEGELQRVVELIHLGAFAVSREKLEPPLPDSYQAAFEEIRADPNALLMVADNAGEVVGTFSLAFIPNISNGGRARGADRIRARGGGVARQRHWRSDAAVGDRRIQGAWVFFGSS